MQVPFYSLTRSHKAIRDALDAAIASVVNQGQFVLGYEVEQFEQEFAHFIGTKYCIGVGSGLDALTISLRALGIGDGDEVLLPSHTCHATWLAVLMVGAKPVPVEVAHFLIDERKLKKVITSKTKAIMPVHLYGYPCPMDGIMKLASEYGLSVVEDFAQAQGAMWNGKRAGSFGRANGTSLYPTKNLGALGDGGALTTDSEEIANFARAHRNYGSAEKNIHTQLGINSRLDEIQAAILRIKLRHLSQWNQERITTAKRYFEGLGQVKEILLPPMPTKMSLPVFHQFVIQTNKREKLMKYLAESGIETSIHYPRPIHLQKAYGHLGYAKGSLPEAERLSEQVLSLPIWPGILNEEVDYVCEQIIGFFKTL